MTPEAAALAQALLDHHRQVCRARINQEAEFESCLIPYGDLCDKAGVLHLKPTVGRFLREIAHWCHENRWPPLNSLAVNRETDRPGRGYDAAPGCSLERWRDQAAACIEFAGYPDTVP